MKYLLKQTKVFRIWMFYCVESIAKHSLRSKVVKKTKQNNLFRSEKASRLEMVDSHQYEYLV